MWSIAELKQTGKEAFKRNYWRCVLVALILGLLTSGSAMTSQTGTVKNVDTSGLSNEALAVIIAIVASIILVFTVVWLLLRIFLLNPLEVGCRAFLKDNITENADLDRLKAGFADYKRSAVTILLRDVFLALWFCLVIPGFIKVYSYRLVPYIIVDNPELSPTEVITRSREMMNGNKWRAFLLDLSFIGWMLLAIVTCGIAGVFYTTPYMKSTQAALYLKLRDNA
ncbi:MAG: DUF975 family protein [Lachnospiraceae bacterium]|nr:DUF975 family protein [Lachnospiraceae bacterium]